MAGLREKSVCDSVSEHPSGVEEDIPGRKKKEGADSLLSFCQNTRHLYQVFFGLFSGYENLSVRQITIVNLIISLNIKT
ncbi:hypothetical protein D3502_23855 [Salmonella enterica]|nr:hypothetical protein [Salmonella enterica]EBM7136329.1 hypothetical protein [Salmonella enterica]